MTGGLLNSLGYKEPNYSQHNSYANLYPYVNVKYKSDLMKLIYFNEYVLGLLRENHDDVPGQGLVDGRGCV